MLVCQTSSTSTPGPELQESGFLGPGHPRADFLVNAGHHVVLLFEDAVDAELVRHFLLKQAGALGDGSRDVGGDPVHRVVVGPEDVLPAQH
jgi:hypothetical protein